MECMQEILHWLARNDLQELSERFQTHKITSLRRLYCLNLNLIKELIPEIGLRMDFIECWTQFKLRGTLREMSEFNGQEYPGRSNITYQPPRVVSAPQDVPQRICPSSQEMPIEIVEVHSSNQNTNVGIVEYPVSPNLPYLQRINVAVPSLQSRSISYHTPSRVAGNQQQNTVEFVELENIQDNNSGDEYPRKPVISIQDARSVRSNPDENPFEMILGHSVEDNINRGVPPGRSIEISPSEQDATNSGPQRGDNSRLLSPGVRSEGTADSGWASSSSPTHTETKRATSSKKKPGPKGKRKVDTKSSPTTEEKRRATLNSYELLRALDMKEFLLSSDAKTKAAVLYYQVHGTLTQIERSAICNAVAKMLMKNIVISAAEYHLAAQKICEVFPSESEVLYYCPPDITKKKPSGKLINKVKNIKHTKNQNKLLQSF